MGRASVGEYGRGDQDHMGRVSMLTWAHSVTHMSTHKRSGRIRCDVIPSDRMTSMVIRMLPGRNGGGGEHENSAISPPNMTPWKPWKAESAINRGQSP